MADGTKMAFTLIKSSSGFGLVRIHKIGADDAELVGILKTQVVLNMTCD